MSPILLAPSGKDYLWGGNRLKTEYGKDIELTPLAETWECSVHPNGPCYAISGEYRGMSLAEIIQMHPEYVGHKNNQIPVLIKFIDAAKDLSVQVHPSDEYAREHENGQNGKTEMWYVLEAKEGAKLVWGFEHKVTKEILEKDITDGTLQNDLHYVPVHKGDVFLIESGTVHAIGEGILLAEIQENSDLTYRLYDYNRKDKNGNLRELHFGKAVQVLNMNPIGDTSQKPRYVRYFYGCSREMLCRCKYFETEKIQVTKGFSFSVMNNSFQVLLCTDGEGGLETDGGNRPLRFKKGSCIFLPAGLGRCHVIGSCELLKIRC
ncbi:type I phosphomannose isomerase catalytic subunit [Bilifractor sp. LCP19S3_H10]|uniref:type I phosphomannose isomerase catalytic subunit n=1 Tax=Bilifractor sp. LCP19S3_H10 TaxID=3438736 RepID=UPI003F92E3BE